MSQEGRELGDGVVRSASRAGWRARHAVLGFVMVWLASAQSAFSQIDTAPLAECAEREKAIVPCTFDARFHGGDADGWILKFVCENLRRFSLEVYDPGGQRQQSIRCDGVRLDAGGARLWDARVLDSLSCRDMDDRTQEELSEQVAAYFSVQALLFPTTSLVLSYYGGADSGMGAYLKLVSRNMFTVDGTDILALEYSYLYGPMNEVTLRETYDQSHAGMLLHLVLFPDNEATLELDYRKPLKVREDLYVPQEVHFVKGYAPGMSLELVPGTFESGISPAADVFAIDEKGRKTVSWSDQNTRVHRGAIVQALLTITALAVAGAWFFRKRLRHPPAG